MELKDQLKKALEELRKENEKRKFEQTVELIVNLKGFDIKKIRAGRLFRSGRNYRDRQGLEGAFRELKDSSHGGIADNLSAKNIAKFGIYWKKN